LNTKLLTLQWSFQSLTPKIQSVNLMGVKLTGLWAQETACGSTTAQCLTTFSRKYFTFIGGSSKQIIFITDHFHKSLHKSNTQICITTFWEKICRVHDKIKSNMLC
jgi:hypothetical protein